MKTAASFLINAKGRDRNGSDVSHPNPNSNPNHSEAGDNNSYKESESISMLPDEGSVEVTQQQREEESQLLSTTGTAGLLQSNERLPRAVERFLLSELAQHAHEIIEGHPLAGSLSAAMVTSLGKELSKEVGGIAAAAFFAFMHHRQGILELPECLINGTLTHFSTAPPADGDEPPVKLSAVDRRVRDQVREAVDHVLQISSGIFISPCLPRLSSLLFYSYVYSMFVSRSPHGALGSGDAVPDLPALPPPGRPGPGAEFTRLCGARRSQRRPGPGARVALQRGQRGARGVQGGAVQCVWTVR